MADYFVSFWTYLPALMNGLKLTMTIAIGGIVLAIVVGIILCIFSISSAKVIKVTGHSPSGANPVAENAPSASAVELGHVARRDWIAANMAALSLFPAQLAIAAAQFRPMLGP